LSEGREKHFLTHGAVNREHVRRASGHGDEKTNTEQKTDTWRHAHNTEDQRELLAEINKQASGNQKKIAQAAAKSSGTAPP
jgi:hypothetical protein